ncbi:hypothetical protein [Nitrosospira sp. Is2]|uniref:hypothetical protein n=1 Tax=Nitrosospira sp. Is2 TaxID=3080532 RepID=UPI002954511B|nr:hypothetical protein [Nitrosospira sp. Is2]WON74078.1 hypothetical protein R5L00_00900 [Nitrosospira sp. Is2]
MNLPRFVATFSLLAVFAAASPLAGAAENFDIDAVVKSAKTRSDHEAVAKYYEDAAKEAQVKASEQQSLLEEYESKGYLYGRNAEDMKSRASAALRKYEKAAQSSSKEAAMHRQMAAQLGDSSGEHGAKAFNVANEPPRENSLPQ